MPLRYGREESKEDAHFFDTLEERGEASVRADLDTARWGTRFNLVRRWLHTKDELRASERAELDKRMVAATEKSAAAARDSANWALWAIGISLVSAIIAVAALMYKS